MKIEPITQIKKLYQDAFGDSTEYVNYVFDEVYTNRRLRYTEENGIVLSALGIMPRSFSYAGKNVSGAFISGVVTEPKARKKGVMKALMKNVLQEFSSKQSAVVFLSPKDEAYYKSQGFCTILKANLMEIKANAEFFKTKTIENSQEYHYLKIESSKDFFCSNQRSSQFSEKLFNSHKIDGTQIKKVYDNEKYLGYFVDDKDGIYEYCLPVKYMDKVETKSSKWYVFGEGQSFVMARILNPFLFFSDLNCESSIDITITVVDNFLQKEYGIRFLSENRRLNCFESQKNGQKITIEELTLWAFGLKKLDLLDGVFVEYGQFKMCFSDRYL